MMDVISYFSFSLFLFTRLWVFYHVVDPGIDFGKETMGDLVMKGALELALEAYNLKSRPPIHQ
jgi:hypothetical protein